MNKSMTASEHCQTGQTNPLDERKATIYGMDCSKCGQLGAECWHDEQPLCPECAEMAFNDVLEAFETAFFSGIKDGWKLVGWGKTDIETDEDRNLTGFYVRGKWTKEDAEKHGLENLAGLTWEFSIPLAMLNALVIRTLMGTTK